MNQSDYQAQDAVGLAVELVQRDRVRMVGGGSRSWENRAHFFGAASEAMRRILIERARRKARLKHGGGQERMNIEDFEVAESLPDETILLVDEALERLKIVNPEIAQVVVLKFFGGLTNEEIVEITGTSVRTVKRQWNYARAWLFNSIAKHL